MRCPYKTRPVDGNKTRAQPDARNLYGKPHSIKQSAWKKIVVKKPSINGFFVDLCCLYI